MKEGIHKRGRRLPAWLVLGGVGMIAIVGMLIYVIGSKMALEEPLYYRYLMEHYKPTIEDSVLETSTIQLKYVTNVWDQREIETVVFEDHPELTIIVLQQNTTRYGIYKVADVRLYMEWNQKAVEEVPAESIINRIQVNYSDGSIQNTDIGKICIYSGEETTLLEAYDCIPLWESDRVQTYEATKDIVVHGMSEITNTYLEEADLIESYSLKASEEDIENVNSFVLKKGEMLTFSMKIKGDKEKRLLGLHSKYDYYEIEPKIVVQGNGGEEQFTVVSNPPITLEFESFKDVREYIKYRKERIN